ncbi:MAG: KR domain-containing protein, partial [Myxococcales bacterium]
MANAFPAVQPAKPAEPAEPVRQQQETLTPGSEPWLRKQIVTLTGFPDDMIRRESEFERDLGLDSLTLVEIYAALVKEFPPIEARRKDFQKCRAVGQVLELLADIASGASSKPASSPTPPKPVPVKLQEPNLPPPVDSVVAAVPVADLQAEIIERIVAAKGIDRSSIHGTTHFDDDLNLDAFTRNEIVEAIVRMHPELALAGNELGRAQTVDELVRLCKQLGHAPLELQNLDRFVRVEVPVVEAKPQVWPSQVLLVSQPGLQADALEKALLAQGVSVLHLRLEEQGWVLPGGQEPIGFEDWSALGQALQPLLSSTPVGVLYASGDGTSWERAVEWGATGLFVVAKALEAAPGVGWLAVLGTERASTAWTGARGVARALAREWPKANVRCMWLREQGTFDPHRVVDALFSGPSELDVVQVGERLLRRELQVRACTARAPSAVHLDASSLVLLVGGGDGITAEIGYGLARKYQCRLAIVGRTAMPTSLPLPEASDDASVMRLLVEQLRRDGWSDGSSEAEMLRERLRGVSRQRAVWRTRERLVRAGSPCFYEQADATKEGELARALEAIRAAHGPIHGVVHGAGCIEDARIGAKSLESFRRVLHAKAHSTRHLRALLERDPMQFAFLFSSLAAHTGTAGQTDYVAANEIVGAVAEEWNRVVSYPVRALLWGVWSEAGLASRALKRQMTRLG